MEMQTVGISGHDDSNVVPMKRGQSKLPASADDARLAEYAEKIRNAHAECGKLFHKSAESAKDAGRCLIEAKKLLKHGQWEKWVETNTKLNLRTVRFYMQAARRPTLTETASLADLAIPKESDGQSKSRQTPGPNELAFKAIDRVGKGEQERRAFYDWLLGRDKTFERWVAAKSRRPSPTDARADSEHAAQSAPN